MSAAKLREYKTAQRSSKVAGLFGSKKDRRPIDVGLASLVGSDEATAIEFWKKRFELTAAVPNDIARVGALTPQMRELTRIDNLEERKRLTKARLIAFAKLAPEQRQLIAAARRKAFDVDRGVMEADQKLVDELLPTLDSSVRSAYPQS
jgi:acyl CoA:acetate/3-ketoacid CoA transferase